MHRLGFLEFDSQGQTPNTLNHSYCAGCPQLKNNNQLSSDIIDYTVNDTNNLLDEIIITNFGDKTRINQLINTIMWTFSKMLEKNIR